LDCIDIPHNELESTSEVDQIPYPSSVDHVFDATDELAASADSFLILWNHNAEVVMESPLFVGAAGNTSFGGERYSRVAGIWMFLWLTWYAEIETANCPCP
jgi:hypothetical protein